MSAYFDHIFASPIDPRVVEAMIPFLRGTYGSPISQHKIGREAAAAIQNCRERVAACINASPDEIIFTSGGIEANNLAIKGLLTVHDQGQLIASAVEPLSVLKPAESLERWGYSTSLLPVNNHAQIELLHLKRHINKFTKLASAAWVVAEVGTVQPIEEIAKEVKSHGVTFHCDATIAARYFPLDVKSLNVDAMTLCGSPLAGPPATGALYLRENTRLQPLFDGGPQEMGRRSGKENLPGIVGFTTALELQVAERQARFKKPKQLDKHLRSRLLEIPDLVIHADLPSRVPGVMSCRVEGIESEALLIMLDEAEVYASAGSPCASMLRKASHVLTAMGLSPEQAASSLNFSLSWDNEIAEIDEMIAVLKPALERLKAMSY